MKNLKVFGICFLALFAMAPVFAQMNISTAQAHGMPGGTPVTLTGNIVQQLGETSYLFRDSSGTINLVIGPNVWAGLYVGPSDLVEVSGELRRAFANGPAELHVTSIRRSSGNAPPRNNPAPPQPPSQGGQRTGMTSPAGFSLGAEFGIDNISEKDDLEMEPYLTRTLAYRNTFRDRSLELQAEMNYTVGLSEYTPREINLGLAMAYNLFTTQLSTYAIHLKTGDNVTIAPEAPEGEGVHTAMIAPGISYRNNSSGIYARLDLPVAYLQKEREKSIDFDLEVSLGFVSSFGLGLDLKFYSFLDRENGITISPELKYTVRNRGFSFYANCEFSRIYAMEAEIMISPALGLMFNF